MGMYEVVYCVASAVGTYALSQMMDMLYGKSRTKGYVRLLSFGAYFIASTVSYLAWDIPILNLLFNICSLWALSYQYEADIKKRLFIIILMYGIGITVEALIWIFSGNMGNQFSIFDSQHYSSISGIILNHLWLLAIVTFFKNIKEIRGGKNMSVVYWACLVAVPLFSMYFIFVLIWTSNALTVQMVLSMIALFVVNISVSVLYNYIVKSMSDQAEKMLLEEQNRSYEEQLKIMQSSFLSIKTLKHDLKNHFIVLENMLRANQADLASKYIEEILEGQLEAKKVISGNLVVDSILGFKLQNAENEEISCSFKLRIPEQLPVASKDMAVILGNIFDNAIEAVRRLPKEERWINIAMKYDKDCLIIEESNPFDGQKRKNWKTIKEDEENHGMGLYNIKKTVELYGGWCEIDEEKKNIFVINILLYLKNKSNIF